MGAGFCGFESLMAHVFLPAFSQQEALLWSDRYPPGSIVCLNNNLPKL
jgi:hypothetical protein